MKLYGVLWIKASGKWLAHAGREEILVPVDLDEINTHSAQDGFRRAVYESIGAQAGSLESRYAPVLAGAEKLSHSGELN